ncbi:MAG: DUF2142 domain-containing protein [Clostridia bacterium]|nr:DUF2142 domain-containing protein [Clostridia bacterium]
MDKKQFRRISMERLFLLLYIPFVLAMMLVMPVGGPPDEQAHLRQAWLLSTGQIGTETCVYPENLRTLLADSTGGTENSILEGEAFRTARISEETVTDAGNEATGIYPQASYLPQSLMMFLTRLFTDRIILLLYSARIGSMIVTGLLFFFAIRRSPAGKMILLAVALLPLTLQEAASASCDGMSIAGICWIAAELLRRISGNGERKAGGPLRYAGMGILAVLCKLTYAPILLLGIMPKAATDEEKKQKRRENLIMAAAFLIAAVIWYLSSVMKLSGRGGLTGDAMNRFGNILTHPLTLIATQVRTLIHMAPGWIRQLFGVLGRLDVFSPWPLTILVGVTFLGVAVTDNGIAGMLPDRKQGMKLRLLLILVVLFSWMLLSGALLIWWTEEGAPVIKGIQGRYFLPCLFCLLLCLPQLKADKRDKVRNILLACYLVCSAITIVLLGMKV